MHLIFWTYFSAIISKEKLFLKPTHILLTWLMHVACLHRRRTKYLMHRDISRDILEAAIKYLPMHHLCICFHFLVQLDGINDCLMKKKRYSLVLINTIIATCIIRKKEYGTMNNNEPHVFDLLYTLFQRKHKVKKKSALHQSQCQS